MLDFHGGPVFKTRFLFIFYFIYLIFWPSCAAAWKVEDGILVRDALVPSAAEAQNLNCWTTRNRFHKLGDAAKNKQTNKNTSALPQQGAQV